MIAVPLAMIVATVTPNISQDPGDAPVTLRGSPEAMVEQHGVGTELGLTFYQSRDEIEEAVEAGELVPLTGGENYFVADFVDLPYIHQDVRRFVERTGRLYHEACGEPLVVTSAVRAIDEQPPNAHELSVHPAGVAVDFRVSPTPGCIEWFEEKLLALETLGAVNATRERNPPHYHVAVYPETFLEYANANPLPELPEPEAPVDPGEADPSSIATLVAVLAGAALIAGVGYLIWRREPRVES